MHGGDRAVEVQAAATLSAMLDDTVVFFGSFDALAALEDVVADRLFNVNIFPGLAGPDRDQRVPVIARGDRNGVKFLVVECLANVLNALRSRLLAVFYAARSPAQFRLIRVDQIRDLHLFLAGPFAHVVAAAATAAGDADADGVVGPNDLARCLGAGNGKEWKGGAGGSRFFQKFASR